MYQSFSIKFYLRKPEGPKVRHKLYCRLLLNRRKSEFSTNIVLDPKYWDEQRDVSKFGYVNEELTEIRAKLYRIKRSLEDKEQLFHPRDIIDVLKDRKKDKHYILEYFTKYVERITAKREHAASTLKHHRLALKYFKQFIEEKLIRDDLLIKEITYETLEEFDYFLKVDIKEKHDNEISRNHINKQHSKLRSVLNQSIKEGIISFNPYRDFVLKDTYVQREALSSEELKRLETDPLDGIYYLDRVRDIFLFSVYTSFRYSAAMDLKMDDIQDPESDEPYISILLDKSKNKTITVPLIHQAIAIIEKYENDSARVVKGYILPRLSNSKINLHLKDIALMLHINKKLSHHIARHTFATHGLNLGIPKEVIQEIMGHSSIKTTDIYARMSIAKKKEEMKKLE